MHETDFDVIWEESLKSATGLDGELRAVFPGNSPHFEKEFLEVLDGWTQTPKRESIEPILMENDVEVFQINHPAENDFLQEDLKRIAQVRYLGKVILEVAKNSLLGNAMIKDSLDNEFLSFEIFRASQWFRAHERTAVDNGRADNFHPEVASPLRLAQWPNGEKLSCLGIAIASCAVAELQGRPYLFGTEARHSMAYVAFQHKRLMDQVRKRFPDFESETARLILADMFHARTEKDSTDAEIYEDLLYGSSPSLIVDPEDTIRDFHHYGVIEYQEEETKRLLQMDPYSLILRTLELDASALTADGTKPLQIDPQTVVLTDESEIYNKDLLRYYELLIEAENQTASARKVIDALNAKSINFAVDAINAARRSNLEMYRKYFGEAIEELLPEFEKVVEIELETILLRLFAGYPELKKGTKENEKLPLGQFLVKLCEVAGNRIKYDTVFRKKFVDAIATAPYYNFLNYYATDLQHVWQVRESGTANPVAELADPKFMIGAMYMNHYATYRKDGRINIARHLARLNPSQFLWQAARQDDFVDDRVNAVGEIVKNLKPRQRHPLVNIASALPTPK